MALLLICMKFTLRMVPGTSLGRPLQYTTRRSSSLEQSPTVLSCVTSSIHSEFEMAQETDQ